MSSYTIHVTNIEPETTSEVAEPLLTLFQQYTQAEFQVSLKPFTHQAEVFKLVTEQDKSGMLVAGTAAGKTLAIGIPLFHKLQTKRIRRVLLMYPTIALMNDQRRVMDKLAELTGQSVGHIQGGMPRSALVAQLNKPVIVATPDAIYWFFQKNVKYSGLLIYALALIDEVVLDEAHLFNGLTLRNLFHLKQRMTKLAESLGRRQCWHILTATPTTELKKLAGEAKIVTGRSKCGEVQAVFWPPVSDPKNRDRVLAQAVSEALQNGANKILLVFNSAAAAHRLFGQIRGEQPSLSIDLQRRFGFVLWCDLRQWLAAEIIPAEIGQAITAWVEQEGPFYLSDLSAGVNANVSTEKLTIKIGQFLQQLSRRLKDMTYQSARQQAAGQLLAQAIEQRVSSQGKAVKALWRLIRAKVADSETTPDAIKQALNIYLTSVNENLDRLWGDETLSLTAPDFSELADGFRQAGLPPDIRDMLMKRLKFSLELDEAAVGSVSKSATALDKRPIALRWLGERWLIKAEDQRRLLRERLTLALQENRLKVETRHIATWGETGVPAIIYTGQMSRGDREGSIEVFDKEMARAVLVSTPAVEVGVDFKAGVMITEECDGNGFLQRFGRVGRTGQGVAQVIVLLRQGETFIRLQQRSQTQMSREDFSRLIIDPQAPADPQRSLFPDRTYAVESLYQDASHWLVNRQLGRIEQSLNPAMFPNPAVAELGGQMVESELPFTYGLRGTLPEVSLLGGGGGSPFYVLSKVLDKDLVAADSPFEVAQAQVSYTPFLYTKPFCAIEIDWKPTLAGGQAMFYWLDGRWQMVSGYGIVESYLEGYKLLRYTLGNNWDLMQQKLAAPHPRAQAIARLGDALKLLTTPQAGLILAQGDIFLIRRERDGGGAIGPVRDRLENPLVLPDQMWLYLLGDAEEIRRRLRQAKLDNLNEVRYPGPTEEKIILLDEVAGGCFYIYERLVGDAA